MKETDELLLRADQIELSGVLQVLADVAVDNPNKEEIIDAMLTQTCLLYTSDAADE